MFNIGDVIDGKYKVEGVCSETGGMGSLLFVFDIREKSAEKIVLKYCKELAEEYIKRFKREVRLLSEFEGNSKVVQLIDCNLEYEPPYFVMKYYPDGDLLKLGTQLRENYKLQETVFFQMIDCISELHLKEVYHRDIKPQNFLLDHDSVVVSDFGLSLELASNTAFTRSSNWWGTRGYLPPEFQDGGFKHPDATGDIFMMGKSFYALLTGRSPEYLLADGVPAPIFHIIERCCALDKRYRYQSISELKQGLASAYDVLLHRTGHLRKTEQLLASIIDSLQREGKYQSNEVSEFIEELSLLDNIDKIKICLEIDYRLFLVLKDERFVGQLPHFLDAYQEMVEAHSYSWSYAERIANNMNILFYSDAVSNKIKARVLGIAIHAADYMNRYAAMDTCRAMITSVSDEELGFEISDVLLKHKLSFVAGIEVSGCKCVAIRNALRKLQEQNNAQRIISSQHEAKRLL